MTIIYQNFQSKMPCSSWNSNLMILVDNTCFYFLWFGFLISGCRIIYVSEQFYLFISPNHHLRQLIMCKFMFYITNTTLHLLFIHAVLFFCCNKTHHSHSELFAVDELLLYLMVISWVLIDLIPWVTVSQKTRSWHYGIIVALGDNFNGNRPCEAAFPTLLHLDMCVISLQLRLVF